MEKITQAESDKKYRSKFKQQRLQFTPNEMQDLTEYCKECNIPKTVFCKEVILRAIYGGIEMKENELCKLAKIFVKHNYFSEDKKNYENYELLLDIYNCLSQKSKDELLEHYKIQKHKI